MHQGMGLPWLWQLPTTCKARELKAMPGIAKIKANNPKGNGQMPNTPQRFFLVGRSNTAQHHPGLFKGCVSLLMMMPTAASP